MLKVMIAEDDLIIADLLNDVLVDGGYEVCGIARTVNEAVELGELHKPDLAVLDIRLAEGGLGMEVAARLSHQPRLGVLYASGHIGQMGLTKADGSACISKPYRAQDIVRALKIVEQMINTGEASRPFPKGFELLNGPGRSRTATVAGNNDFRVIRRLRRQQEVLAEFGSFALVEHDLGKVLTEAARACAEGLEVAFCKICRYRMEENDLFIEAGVGWRKGVIGSATSRADESSPAGRAFATGKSVVCGDVTKDLSFMLPSFYAEHGIVSTLDVIINREGQPYGVLEIDSPVQHDYDQNDINFVTGFANVVAEAVNGSKRNATLVTVVDRIQDMIADRDRLITTRNSLLDQKAVLARELQHRVRNNLQFVHGMLSKYVLTNKDDAGNHNIAAIARRVMTLAQVYDQLIDVGLCRTINFGEYLHSFCSNLAALENAQYPEVELSCHCEPVLLDLDGVTAIGLVISELMSNSYAHAFPGGRGSIKVSLHRDETGDDATLTFADDGIGFTQHGDAKWHGLALVKRLMEQVSGSATLRSDHGSEWTLKFPVPTNLLVD